MDGLLESVRIIGVHRTIGFVQQGTFPVPLVDVAERPAVAVKIGETCVGQLRVEIGKIGQKLGVGPFAALGGRLRVGFTDLLPLLGSKPTWLVRVHVASIRFVVPPHGSIICVHHARTGVNVADHALARGDGTGEPMTDRVAGFLALPSDHRIVGARVTPVAVGRPGARVGGVAVVGVYHVAGGAAAGAKIPRVVVGSHEGEQRVHQSGFLESEPNRIGAVQGTQSPVGKPSGRPSRLLQGVRIADLQRLPSTPLENP